VLYQVFTPLMLSQGQKFKAYMIGEPSPVRDLTVVF
jgi:hypothetical protein